MYHDMLSREYGKARQEMYLQEAQEYRYQAANEADAPEEEREIAPSMGGILGFLRWIFRPGDVASADGNP